MGRPHTLASVLPGGKPRTRPLPRTSATTPGNRPPYLSGLSCPHAFAGAPGPARPTSRPAPCLPALGPCCLGTPAHPFTPPTRFFLSYPTAPAAPPPAGERTPGPARSRRHTWARLNTTPCIFAG